VNKERIIADVNRFLDGFPDDTASWAEATDELPDLYAWLTKSWNEICGAEMLLPVGRENCKTPSEWNQKYKAAIRRAMTEVSFALIYDLRMTFSWFGPSYCPVCAGEEISAVVQWSARPLDPQDADNVTVLTEYQCRGRCEGRSFWA
jgi:hypothetical protein